MVGQVSMNGAGGFVVDGQTYDLGTLMMMLNLDRTKQIDRQIADQMSEIKERNERLKELNDLLAIMRQRKAEGKDDDKSTHNIDGTNRKLWRGDDSLANKYGITWTDVKGSDDRDKRDAQWDTNIEAVKGKIDSLNSDSQLDMIRLQSLIDKRNQSFDMASNQLSSDKKSKEGIIGNMR